MKPDVLVESLVVSLVESLVPDESTAEELLLPSLSAAVLSPDGLSTASSEVSDVSGTLEDPGGC